MVDERQDYITMITFETGRSIHIELLNLLTLEQLKIYYSEIIAWINSAYIIVFTDDYNSYAKKILQYKQFAGTLEFIANSSYIGLEFLLKALSVIETELGKCR